MTVHSVISLSIQNMGPIGEWFWRAVIDISPKGIGGEDQAPNVTIAAYLCHFLNVPFIVHLLRLWGLNHRFKQDTIYMVTRGHPWYLHSSIFSVYLLQVIDIRVYNEGILGQNRMRRFMSIKIKVALGANHITKVVLIGERVACMILPPFNLKSVCVALT